MGIKNNILKKFAKIYGNAEGARVFFAPGRVNLIGEHTDYNGGHVFPCSLTLYPKGMMWAFGEKRFKMDCGLDIVVKGNIPHGSGLFSSASVEIVTGYMLKVLFGFEISNQELALIGQYSENKFNGVNCGIMDQFAIAMGKKDCAIFLDTADLTYEYAQVNAHVR